MNGLLILSAAALVLSSTVSAGIVYVSHHREHKGACIGNVSPAVTFPELGFVCEGIFCNYNGDDYAGVCAQLKVQVEGCGGVDCSQYARRQSCHH